MLGLDARFRESAQRGEEQRIPLVRGGVPGAQLDGALEFLLGARPVVAVHGQEAQRRVRLGESGVLPGSMGSLSFHVEGRGCEEALCSSAHGAGLRS